MAQNFLPPRSTAAVMPKEQLLRQFANLGDILTAGTLVIDVRRTDYEGGTIRGSLNIPAQGFCLSMPALHRLCAGDGLAVISRVVFYCGSCGSRGPRCAGWFQDYVADLAAKQGAPPTIQVFILEGGIKGWVAGGDEYTLCMDGFEPSHWQQTSESGKEEKRPADPDTAVQGTSAAEGK